MDQLVQCPVCTLYLHNGMSLESHLDTHPKDQVIRALCNLSVTKSSYSSRSSTPTGSELLFKSRSQTPASDETKPGWASTVSNIDNDRYWRRGAGTPSSAASLSRVPSRLASSTPGLVTSPGIRVGELTVENVNKNLTSSPVVFSGPYSVQSGRPPLSTPTSECEPPYQQEDIEIKYSKSVEYNQPTTSNVFAVQRPPPPYLKLPRLAPAPPKTNSYVNINVSNSRRELTIPKPNNVSLLKTDIGVQYIASGRQPMHVVLPASTQTFVPQNNIIVTGNISNTSQTVQSGIPSPILANQLTTSTFTPTKTVVTQNSQIIHREMVHSMDGKALNPGMPEMLGNNDLNLDRGGSVYQNVMVVNPYKNASCMCGSQAIPSTSSFKHKCVHKSVNNSDANKTLVIEIGPNLPDMLASPKPNSPSPVNNEVKESTILNLDTDSAEESGIMKKGLKILSNIKVEVPVQHDISLLNKIVDLTGPCEVVYPDPNLVEIKPVKTEIAHISQPSTSTENTFQSNTFSVIKNIGNPAVIKEPKICPDKISDIDSTDSCPVPDLICNEKPSISPCSELSENGDNAIDHTSISNKRMLNIQKDADELLDLIKQEKNHQMKESKPYWNHNSNVFMKKQKKVLKIKNSKSSPGKIKDLSLPSCSGLSDEITIKRTKIVDVEKKESKQHSITVRRLTRDETCRRSSFDTDTEVQSMDIEPVAHTSFSQISNFPIINIAPVKDEIGCNNDTLTPDPDASHFSEKEMTSLETIRPINIINYANISENFDDDSNHRELIDLEVASKNKQFVNMMNDNYFGDNIYADYFTPDKVESFESARESDGYTKDGQRRESEYLWGETPQKEYILPNFVNNDYKIMEGTSEGYNGGGLEDVEFGGGELDGDLCEQDSKMDVLSESRSESEVDICANEKMPPRGELSGQESNGDMDTPWTGMYPEVPPPEPYDLMARESWISDSSDIDTSERTDQLEMDLPMVKPVLPYSCTQCDVRMPSLKDLDIHITLTHNITKPTVIRARPSEKIRKKAIKQESKCDIKIIPETPTDSKAHISNSIFEEMKNETKPNIAKIRDMIKKEPSRLPKKDFVCPTCKEDLLTYANFREHLQIHPLECLTCGKCFYKRHNLNLHMRMHLGIRNFKCEVCEKRFSTRHKLKEHTNVHTGRAPFRCNFCDESFRRYSNMLQHRDRHHLNKKPKIRDFVCHCGEIFHSRAKLHWHTETHEEKPKACPYCSDKFIHTASLTRHIRRTHNSCYIPQGREYSYGMENVPCPICKQVYLRGTLKAHLATHSDKRPFVCVICNKSFTTKWNLKLHRWIHMNRSSKPFKCTLCKGAFIRQTEYISHMNAHKSVRPYTCNYCGCQFIRKYNCQRHVKEHEMDKKFVCKVPDCGKAFHRSYYLTEHMRVHSGARPFSCNVCGKTSSNKSNHNKHVKVHHSRDPIATEA